MRTEPFSLLKCARRPLASTPYSPKGKIYENQHFYAATQTFVSSHAHRTHAPLRRSFGICIDRKHQRQRCPLGCRTELHHDRHSSGKMRLSERAMDLWRSEERRVGKEC